MQDVSVFQGVDYAFFIHLSYISTGACIAIFAKKKIILFFDRCFHIISPFLLCFNMFLVDHTRNITVGSITMCSLCDQISGVTGLGLTIPCSLAHFGILSRFGARKDLLGPFPLSELKGIFTRPSSYAFVSNAPGKPHRVFFGAISGTNQEPVLGYCMYLELVL